MRNQAPDEVGLIQSKLIQHDATGVAEDYLDMVGWPFAGRHLIVPRRAKQDDPHPVQLLRRQRVGRTTIMADSIRQRPLVDPRRN